MNARMIDRVLGVLTGVLVVYLLGLATAHAEAATFPFEDKDCGTIGNVLAIAGHWRDEGGSQASFAEQAAIALKECRAENGPENCSVRNQAQQDFVDASIKFLWDHSKQDGAEFATEFYNTCKERAAKPL